MDHFQSSALSTSPARRGFRSIKRNTVLKVVVFLNGMSSESPLPNVAAGMIVLVVAAYVSGHEPLHVVAEIAIIDRPESQMKVIRHDADAEKPHGSNISLGRRVRCVA
jgi:hypothetical protein